MSLKGKTIRYSLHVNFKFIGNKNVFQWDAYRPLQWPSRGVSAYGVYTPWTDRRLWKYYLSATTVADGKYWYDDSRLEVAWDNNLFLSWYPALVMKHSVIDFHYVWFKILLLQVRIYLGGCLLPGGAWSRGMGVSAPWGVPGPGGGGVCSRGVSAAGGGGVSTPGGVPGPRGCFVLGDVVSQFALRQTPPWTEWQTGVKT